MIDIFPRSYYSWFKRGLAKRKNSDNKGAVEDYTRSISLKKDYKTYANRAVAYLALGNKESAYDDLEECLKLNPKDDIALGNRGRLKIEKGEYSESIIDFDKAIEIYPENAFNFHCRAFAKYKINDQQGAQEDWNIAADMGLEIASKALKDYFHKYSWNNYYQEFQSKLLKDRRLILSLKDNEESEKLLNHLGYKFDPKVEQIDNCKIGGYYYWTANIYLNYDDENDTEIDVIDIHHWITLEWIISYEEKGEEWLIPLVEKWFGIKKEYIANISLADGIGDLDFL